MRDETTMMTLILTVARETPAVRAVVMNGSRVNDQAVKDSYQDYDIVYYLTDESAFTSRQWATLFGEILIMQTGEDMIFDPPQASSKKVYLMQFVDGTRIDLTLKTVAELETDLASDSLSRVLLDLDKRYPSLQEPSDRDYHVKKPSPELVSSCVNEFYWVAFYVLKGLAREQFGYALSHLDIMRRCLEAMLSWSIGFEHDFAISVGKQGAHFKTLLKETWYMSLRESYPHAKTADVLSALVVLLKLFKAVSTEVGKALGVVAPCQPYQRAETDIYAQIETFKNQRSSDRKL